METAFDKLKARLMEMFQLDQPDLDFGIYRIIHAKSSEVTQFLDNDLLPQVRQAFNQYRPADKAELEKELHKALEQAEALGADPETMPKVQALRRQIAEESVDIGSLENEVYDHLYTFFRRYYSEGDFLSRRVYKLGVYAIPYEGEEVTLHWANKDQYYIKTSEYLRDYAFRLQPENDKKPMRVHFRLVDAAEGEHGNVKAAECKDRVFILAAPGASGCDFIAEENGELSIRFEYRPATLTDWPDDEREGKTNLPAQKDLVELAARAVLAIQDMALHPWIEALRLPHVKADGEPVDYSRLLAHLRRYTARNTFDYFIHKDLGGFLRQELDFYIKNEVMHLDDVENESALRVEQYLSKIKVFRKVAAKIIDFLAQLEDFQKKLWLKKKFVVETQYCITLGCIPEDFYPEIATNEAQREEWMKLFAIAEIKGDLTTPGYSNPLTPEFLKAHPTLLVDTRHFDADLTARLLAAMGDVEEQTDGVLFHSENFQCLSLMQQRYREQVKCVYIDPPFNTEATQILYKNDYRHSSWLSLIGGRLRDVLPLMNDEAIICVAIDDFELSGLLQCLAIVFGEDKRLATVLVRSNPHGRAMAAGFSSNHEYALFYAKTECAVVGRLPRDERRNARYPHSDKNGSFTWINFRKTGAGSGKQDRPKLYYPVFVSKDGVVSVPTMKWQEERREWKPEEQPSPGEVAVLPLDSDGTQRVWNMGWQRAQREAKTNLTAKLDNGQWQVYRKYHANQEGALPGTWWDDAKYSATESGTRVVKDILGEREIFSYPKSISLVEDSLRACNCTQESCVIDFFAGSGTTGHAVVNLNREDGGQRKFILVEMGDYFDTVLLPRIKKVTFTPEWKDGKPKRLATPEEAERSPRIVKIICLESYEDTLNNLDLRRTERQQSLLDAAEAQGADGLKEQYLLRYLLDVEARGSQSLLNVNAFTDPTAYTLKVKRPGSDESRAVNADLLETFNYLIGLTVQHIAAPQTFAAAFQRDDEQRLMLDGRLKPNPAGPWWFRTVTGTTPDGLKVLVIWRKQPKTIESGPDGAEYDNLVLDTWFTKQGYSTQDFEFDLIYVNGDNNLENLKQPDDTWKVRLIEDDFHRLMFGVEGV